MLLQTNNTFYVNDIQVELMDIDEFPGMPQCIASMRDKSLYECLSVEIPFKKNTN